MERRIWILALLFTSCGGSGGGGDVLGSDPAPTDPDITIDAGPRCVTADDCRMAAPACRKAVCTTQGTCVVVADETRDGQACDPDDRCALEPKTCKAGECTYGLQRACPAKPCSDARCDPATGECVFPPAADGTVCEADGNPCTSDACQDGACTAGDNTCACENDDACPPVADQCLGSLRCDTTNRQCVIDPATRVTCPPSDDPCRMATCRPTDGSCSLGAVADGTLCPAADSCTTGGFCIAGACVEEPTCRDDNPCTRDDCDPTTGTCTFAPLDGTACDDGDACTFGDVCIEGSCVGEAISCDDDDPCTTDRCDPASGCVSDALDAGASCDDGDPCTEDDACDERGKCAGAPRSCDDGNPCTDDACDPGTGECAWTANFTSCDDEEACTDGDFCREGACVPGRWIPGCCHADEDCEDGSPCTIDACVLGGCEVATDSGRACMATGDGCTRGRCDTGSGQCRDYDASSPVRLVDWDFRGGDEVRGLAWAGYPGAVGEDGIGPAADGAPVTFRLPRQWVEAGVYVVHATLGTGTCDGVDLQVNGAPVGSRTCLQDDGRPLVAWTWTDESRLLDARVVVTEGTAVGRIALFAWAHPACRPMQPVRVWETGEDGARPTRLATAGDGRRTFASLYIPTEMGSAIGYVQAIAADIFGHTQDETTLIPVFSPHEERFAGSMAFLPDGRVAAAHGSVRHDIELLTIENISRAPTLASLTSRIPGVTSARIANTQPSLALDTLGRPMLAWAFSILDTEVSQIAFVRGNVIEGVMTFPEWATPVSDAGTVGRARDPRLWFSPSGGAIAWVTDLATDPPTCQISVRNLSLGASLGDGRDLAPTDAPIANLALTGDGAHVFLAWEEPGGIVKGRVFPRSPFGEGIPMVFSDPPSGATSPTLLPGGPGAALLYLERVGSAFHQVVMARVDDQGIASPGLPLGGLLADAGPLVASPFGPFHLIFAFLGAAYEQGTGLYQGVSSVACVQGNVDCTDAVNPRVCAGLPGMAYVTVPGATRWCP